MAFINISNTLGTLGCTVDELIESITQLQVALCNLDNRVDNIEEAI